jgi:DNA polymerase-1
MIRLRDRLAGQSIRFHCAETKADLREVANFIRHHHALGIDTESTGLNCYQPGWKLRTVQYGNDVDSYVVPQRFVKFIDWAMRQPVKWIGHNGPHDIRCIDEHLGITTGVVCAGETYLPAHHADSRNQREGGIGHGLKELAIHLIDRSAGKWEVELKRVFKTIEVPMPGQFYKSGARKGLPKTRKARLDEGWGLINPMHPAYIAYAAADPILTYRVWRKYQPTVQEFYDLYEFDHRVQMVCDSLQRRAIRLDVDYTSRLSDAFIIKANRYIERAKEYGCTNIHSGRKVAGTLIDLGARLTDRTPTGQYQATDGILRRLSKGTSDPDIREFIRCVLVAKQLLKRRVNYTEAMLREMDKDGRIHPSINSLGARTTRMSVSRPPLQQLPTKDRDEEEG